MFSSFWKYLSSLSRDYKWRLFLRAMKPSPTDLLLDVGPGMGDMLECRYPWVERIVGVDRARNWSVGPVLKDFPKVSLVQADGCRLPFRDEAFDIVFSNAVIEHVKDQHQFAKEIRRVGQRYFVASPNRWFPLETHSKLVFVHWLPHKIAWKIIPLLSKYRHETWLLSPIQMRKLFPGAKIVGNGSSLIAYRV